jgi:GTP cyclohydrolase I
MATKKTKALAQNSKTKKTSQTTRAKTATKKPPAAPLDPITAEIARQMGHTLALLGENPGREGLLNTPKRYAKAMRYLTSGYQGDPKTIIGDALFREGAREMVIVRDIELFSLCEHHLLPFYGKAHVAYIPNGKVVGLSKIPRIVDVFARRLQVQERLTNQIAETLMKELKPLGVAVIIESFHLCMMMRGVEKQNSYTITSSMNGVFKTNDATRKEFLSLLGGLGAKR